MKEYFKNFITDNSEHQSYIIDIGIHDLGKKDYVVPTNKEASDFLIDYLYKNEIPHQHLHKHGNIHSEGFLIESEFSDSLRNDLRSTSQLFRIYKRGESDLDGLSDEDLTNPDLTNIVNNDNSTLAFPAPVNPEAPPDLSGLADNIQEYKNLFEENYGKKGKFFQEDLDNAVKHFSKEDTAKQEEILDRLRWRNSDYAERQVNKEIDKLDRAGMYNVKQLSPEHALDGLADDPEVKKSNEINKALKQLGSPYYQTLIKDYKRKGKDYVSVLTPAWKKRGESADSAHPNIRSASESAVASWLRKNYSGVNFTRFKRNPASETEKLIGIKEKKDAKKQSKVKKSEARSRKPEAEPEMTKTVKTGIVKEKPQSKEARLKARDKMSLKEQDKYDRAIISKHYPLKSKAELQKLSLDEINKIHDVYEDWNYHRANLLLLAKYFDMDEEIIKINKMENHEYSNKELHRIEYDLVSKIYDKWRDVMGYESMKHTPYDELYPPHTQEKPEKEPEAPKKTEKKYESLHISDIPAEVKAFMPLMQMKAIVGSDEHWDVLENLKSIINKMPKTYETDNIKAEDKIIYLHYFHGGSDWYIAEKDSETEQLQAFGFAVLNQDYENAEWGYISIEEIKKTGKVELDFFFEPTKFSDLPVYKKLPNYKKSSEPPAPDAPGKSEASDDDFMALMKNIAKKLE